MDNNKDEKPPLTFRQYREKYRTPIQLMADRCGVSYGKINNLLKGHCPTLKTALLVEAYTRKEVTCKTLLPTEMLKDVEANKYFQELQ